MRCIRLSIKLKHPNEALKHGSGQNLIRARRYHVRARPDHQKLEDGFAVQRALGGARRGTGRGRRFGHRNFDGRRVCLRRPRHVPRQCGHVAHPPAAGNHGPAWRPRGPRNWQVAGMYVDVLGPAESFTRTPYRRVQGPYGELLVMKPEDLLVERVLISVYPGENMAARECAKKLAAMILDGAIPVNWDEVRRLANLPEYRNLSECAKLVKEVADELNINPPLHSD